MMTDDAHDTDDNDSQSATEHVLGATSASPGDHPVVNRVLGLIQPIIDDLGLDLYDLEFGGGILKITADTPPGSPGGIDVDQLSRVTRLVSRELDHSDPIPGHYTLEVSSPGLERTLRTPRHFAREMGKTVAVRLRHVVEGERRITGVLVFAGPETFTVLVDSGVERVVAYDDVDRARTVFVWQAQPKPGKKSGNRQKSSSEKTSKGAGVVSAASSSMVSPADFQHHSDENNMPNEMPNDMDAKADREIHDQESAES